LPIKEEIAFRQQNIFSFFILIIGSNLQNFAILFRFNIFVLNLRKIKKKNSISFNFLKLQL
jgi:hypothetical protein